MPWAVNITPTTVRWRGGLAAAGGVSIEAGAAPADSGRAGSVRHHPSSPVDPAVAGADRAGRLSGVLTECSAVCPLPPRQL